MTLPRKQPFPPEADTQPEMRRPSGVGPKSKSQGATTVPPPRTKRGKGTATETKNSGIRSRKPPPPAKKDDDAPGASVDEVTADLSKDPRRERDD